MLVCPGGLIQVRGTVAEPFAWEQIVSVHERTTKVKLLKGPTPSVPKAASKVYWVNRNDGASIRFDADKLKDDEQLCKMIRAEAIRRSIPWTEDTVVVKPDASSLQCPAFSVLDMNEMIELGGVLDFEVCAIPLESSSRSLGARTPSSTTSVSRPA